MTTRYWMSDETLLIRVTRERSSEFCSKSELNWMGKTSNLYRVQSFVSVRNVDVMWNKNTVYEEEFVNRVTRLGCLQSSKEDHQKNERSDSRRWTTFRYGTPSRNVPFN